MSSDNVTHRCPSWDTPLTEEEAGAIEAKHGPLARNLVELADMLLEMDRRAPRWIPIAERIRVRVARTARASLWAALDDCYEPESIYDNEGNVVEEDDYDGLTSWQSHETLGFLIWALASARMLRPQLVDVVGLQAARDFYVNLYTGLRYEEHSYRRPGKGLVLALRMQWSGEDGRPKQLADILHEWHRRRMLMHRADLEKPALNGGKTKRKTKAAKVAVIATHLQAHPAATSPEIARATGIDESNVRALWGPIKRAFQENRRPKPQGWKTAEGTVEAIDESACCGICDAPLRGPWKCPFCDRIIRGECKMCHDTNTHPDKAVP